MPLFHYFLSIFHHFSPLLSIHLFHCGKCGKLCWKLASFAYKYLINQHKMPVNASKHPKILLVYHLCFLFISLNLLYPLYIGNPWFPYPPLPEKTFSLFSSSPHFVRVAVKPFFIYRTCGSQMKKPTSSCGHFKRKVWNRGMGIVNILLIIDRISWQDDRSVI